VTQSPPNSLIHAAKSGDKAAAERLITENSGLIWSIARRFFGRGVDGDDLYQLGCVGFLKAVKGFDPSFGTKFSTYAVPKISGEIRRFLRDDGSVKVSRGIKEKAAVIRAAREQLQNKYGREPAISDLVYETGFAPEDIAIAETAASPTESLYKDTGGDGLTLESLLGDFSQEETLVEHVSLRQAISTLPDKDRQVIILRYWRGLTQSDTARILKVSQVQVSRLERRAVEALRLMLK